jgi:ArsR family transcriptional regulator
VLRVEERLERRGMTRCRRRVLGRARLGKIRSPPSSIVVSSFIDTLTEDIDRRQYMDVALKQIGVITEACCPQVLRAPLGADEAEEMAAALRVVADPARLRLISLLAKADEACVCELTEPLGLTQPTVSHHLRVLADAGLVDREQRGRWAFFRLVPERVEILRRALSA